MSNQEKNKKQIEWYDNPDIITSFIIALIALIVILSQSFAINNNLSISNILGSILNHNIGYFLVCIYFVALKTKVGKKYFDFLNIFLIILHALRAGTSLLTVFQSFGLGSLLDLSIDLLIFIYLIHTFLRSTRVWKSLSLNKSPFNEISNSGYFYSILVLAIILLAVNLISTTSFDGTILTLMDTGYTVLFIRYVFLYGEFLNNKENINKVVNTSAVKDKVEDLIEEVKDKVYNINNAIEEKIEESGIDEKIDEVKEKIIDIKEDLVEKVAEAKLDEKFDQIKDKVVEISEEIKENKNLEKDKVSTNKRSTKEKKKQTRGDK